ncbi:MAG: flagellar export protein FliJ [Lachnospirales bacterium]
MKGFNFKLNGLLNVKEKIEEQRKIELGKASQILEREKNVLEELQVKRVNSLKFQKDAVAEKVNVIEYNNYINFVKKLDSDIEKQKKRIIREEKNVEKAKESLLEVMKERKAYEKLKEKKLEAFYRETLSREQKVLDEIVTYKHSKKAEGE